VRARCSPTCGLFSVRYAVWSPTGPQAGREICAVDAQVSTGATPTAKGLAVPVVAALISGHLGVKDACMTSEPNSVAKSGLESVALASFDSSRHAEHMLASLGREFRKKARKGGTTAVMVRGNPDGSLKVTESRVLSAGDFVYTVARVLLSWAVGLMGLLATLKGAKERSTPLASVKDTPDRMSTGPTRSSPKLARMRPSHWFAARTSRHGRWSPPQRLALPKIAGMGR
jgi:hypothetical protein